MCRQPLPQPARLKVPAQDGPAGGRTAPQAHFLDDTRPRTSLFPGCWCAALRIMLLTFAYRCELNTEVTDGTVPLGKGARSVLYLTEQLAPQQPRPLSTEPPTPRRPNLASEYQEQVSFLVRSSQPLRLSFCLRPASKGAPPTNENAPTELGGRRESRGSRLLLLVPTEPWTEHGSSYYSQA